MRNGHGAGGTELPYKARCQVGQGKAGQNAACAVFGKSFISPEPYGVALIVSPWNYPVQLCLNPLIGAISAGNCAVVKPSAYAAATSTAIAKLIGDTFPPEYIAAVEGGRAEIRRCLKKSSITYSLPAAWRWAKPLCRRRQSILPR